MSIKKNKTLIIAAVAVIVAIAIFVLLFGGGSKKTPIDGYDDTTTYEQVAKEYKKYDVTLSDTVIQVKDYEWDGMTGNIRFEFYSTTKTLKRIHFSVDVQTRKGHTAEEIWDTYERAEKAYRYVRDYYKLDSIKGKDYEHSKEYESSGFAAGGLVSCYLSWFKGSSSTVTTFWIEYHT